MRNPQSSNREYASCDCVAWCFERLGSSIGPQRRPEHPHGEFHQTIGVVQPRNAACQQKGRENAVDDETHLSDGHSEHGGTHLAQHAAHAFVPQLRSEARQQVEPRELRDLECELKNTADENGPMPVRAPGDRNTARPTARTR